MFRMQLVQILRQPSGVTFRDSKNDCFPWTDLLFWRLLFIRLPSKPIELVHHEAVCFFVCPFPLERSWVIVLLINISALGDDFGDTCRETVRNKMALRKRFADRIREVGRALLALIEVKGITFDVGRRRGGKASALTSESTSFSGNRRSRIRRSKTP